MSETRFILVDTRTLISLAQAGLEGLDTLLIGGQRPIILRDVIGEVRDSGTPIVTQNTILSWLGACQHWLQI